MSKRAIISSLTTERLEEALIKSIEELFPLNHDTREWLIESVNELSDRRKAAAW